MTDYLKWKRETTKNPKTAVMYAMWVKRFLKFLEGEPITLNRVMFFRAYLATLDYSPKNIQYGLTLVRDFISYQMTMHGLEFPLKLLKIPQERSKSHHAITPEEYDKLLSVLPLNHPLTLQRRLMVSLLWDTGMRGGELLRLRISDIKGRSAVIQTEKNSRNRLVAWTEETDKVLRFYLPLRKNLDTGNDFLFVSFRQRPRKALTIRQLEWVFKDTAKKAGLGLDIRPHGMRHGFTHRQLRKKTPITTIAQMLGHSTVFNVLTYAQLASKEIEEAWDIG